MSPAKCSSNRSSVGGPDHLSTSTGYTLPSDSGAPISGLHLFARSPANNAMIRSASLTAVRVVFALPGGEIGVVFVCCEDITTSRFVKEPLALRRCPQAPARGFVLFI